MPASKPGEEEAYIFIEPTGKEQGSSENKLQIFTYTYPVLIAVMEPLSILSLGGPFKSRTPKGKRLTTFFSINLLKWFVQYLLRLTLVGLGR